MQGVLYFGYIFVENNLFYNFIYVETIVSLIQTKGFGVIENSLLQISNFIELLTFTNGVFAI